MIYMVECAFTDPARKAAWNAYYDSDKTDMLLSQPGFRATQRFHAVTESLAPYLAIHSVADESVFAEAGYRARGGGTFDGWDDLVSNWRRNLFAGMDEMPEVSPESILVLCDDPGAAPDGVEFAWLDIAGLDRTVARRGIAVVTEAAGTELARAGNEAVRVYAPITARRVARQ